MGTLNSCQSTPWTQSSRKLAQQMQIVDEQIKVARLRCNLTLRKWPWRMPQQKEVPVGEPLIV